MEPFTNKESHLMCLAVPGQVREVYEAHGTRMGKMNFGGVVKDVCLAYVPEVAVGDYAIVHVGVAISKVDEELRAGNSETLRGDGDSRRGTRRVIPPFHSRRPVTRSRHRRCDSASAGDAMRYLTEFRNGEIAQRIVREIHAVTRGRWRIMEVCGGQTHSIIRNGIDQLLPEGIELIHGPGCPVCVTPLEVIDKALAIASLPGVTFCSFGDMLRVPGSEQDLFAVKSRGGDVRIVYSPLDAVDLAQTESRPASRVLRYWL